MFSHIRFCPTWRINGVFKIVSTNLHSVFVFFLPKNIETQIQIQLQIQMQIQTCIPSLYFFSFSRGMSSMPSSNWRKYFYSIKWYTNHEVSCKDIFYSINDQMIYFTENLNHTTHVHWSLVTRHLKKNTITVCFFCHIIFHLHLNGRTLPLCRESNTGADIFIIFHWEELLEPLQGFHNWVQHFNCTLSTFSSFSIHIWEELLSPLPEREFALLPI